MAGNDEEREGLVSINPQAFHIVTETRNLKAPEFLVSDDQIKTGQCWEEWLEGIEREFRYFRITTPIDKKDAIIIHGGKEISRLERTLVDPIAEEGQVLDEYQIFRKKLNEYFLPQKNEHIAKLKFGKLRPIPGETINVYAARLREKSQECQDVDFELFYEPGKDEQDPLDFLSRHPLPITGTDSTEKIIKQVIIDEYDTLLDRIKQDTKKDVILQKLRKIIEKSDWERHRKDHTINSYYSVKDELYVYDEMIFRLNRIVIPESLQRKVIKAAHNLGHFGTTKTKKTLREKYWFPALNKMVEDIIGQCYECQVTTKSHKQEPVKMSTIPEKPWDCIAIDFGGPYPDGHYNFVAIDKRTRYPEVERTTSTSFKAIKPKLKKMFATYGTPRIIQSDNGPPFNSKEFENFAREEGFTHHRITPLHPRANGEVESFMKVLNKTEQISQLQGLDNILAIQDMLIGYRSSPHPATKVSPYEALLKRKIRTKLDHQQEDREEIITRNDKEYKEKIRNNAENRNTKQHNYVIGDFVLLRQNKINKWSTAYEPAFYVIYRIDGSSIAARRVTDGREVYRDSSHFKLVNSVIQNVDKEIFDPDKWR